jgi:hypothetical protein
MAPRRREEDFILRGVKALNVNGAAVHVVGIDVPAEDACFLFKLAEQNSGTYVSRPISSERRDGSGAEIVGSYERRYTSWRTGLVNTLSKKREESFRKTRLTIGGQLRILQVMLEEQDVVREAVVEELKCAQRLLAAADRPNAFPDQDRDQLKDIQARKKQSVAVRTGGGYYYGQDGPDDVGLDTLFEVKSAVPWTSNSETMAIGPHIVPSNPGVGAQRLPKFPPSTTPLEPGTLPPPAKPKPKAKQRASSRTRPRQTSAARLQSADRAAGGPKQPKVKPQPARKKAPEPRLAPPPVERRWSF